MQVMPPVHCDGSGLHERPQVMASGAGHCTPGLPVVEPPVEPADEPPEELPVEPAPLPVELAALPELEDSPPEELAVLDAPEVPEPADVCPSVVEPPGPLAVVDPVAEPGEPLVCAEVEPWSPAEVELMVEDEEVIWLSVHPDTQRTAPASDPTRMSLFMPRG
jgi:hypothetical protein